MKRREGFILREIAGDYLIVPVGETVKEFNGLVTVNGSGKFLWEMLQDEVLQEDLVRSMVDRYEVSEETARADVEGFVGVLVEKNIVV